MSYRLAKSPWTTEMMSYAMILALYASNKLDLNPAHQREEVATTIWRQKYITDWARGNCHSVLTFRRLKDGRLQSIDGLQRISTGIQFFMQNEFKILEAIDVPINGKFVHMLSAYAKDMYSKKNGDAIMQHILENRQFTVIIYDELMTDEEAAEVFQALNHGTPLNDQEWRQARTHILADYVRETARGITQ